MDDWVIGRTRTGIPAPAADGIHIPVRMRTTSGPTVAWVCGADPQERTRRAFLTAAAPEMLEALKLANGEFELLSSCDCLDGGVWARVTDAIAKAEGK